MFEDRLQLDGGPSQSGWRRSLFHTPTGLPGWHDAGQNLPQPIFSMQHNEHASLWTPVPSSG